MNTSDENPETTPELATAVEIKKELKELAEKTKNPKLVESFNTLLAKKFIKVF